MKTLAGATYRTDATGMSYISALIKIADAATAQQSLDNISAKVGTKAGKVWTVHVPSAAFLDFIQLPGIAVIQIDEPVKPALYKARQVTRADSVQKGLGGLPHGYSGKDVILGVIDFGYDYNHPTFYDTAGAKYRIRKVWELGSTGTPPTGYSYGAELTDSMMIRAAGTDDPKQNHGTSTAGIAGGSGYGSSPTPDRFRGLSYATDIVMVGVRRDSIEQQWLQGSFTDFIDGVNYIFTYADAQGKPCVINISWGSQSGPHDGTSLFAEASDALTGPGKIIVMSAGNEGEENLHLSKTFTATDTALHTYLTFSNDNYNRTWVDIWGEQGKTFCAGASLVANGVAGQNTGLHCVDNSFTDFFLIGSNGLDTCFVQFISDVASFNNKPRMTVTVFNKTTDTVRIDMTGNSGTIHSWNEYYYYGFREGFSSAYDSLGDPTATNGNTDFTVSDMGSGFKTLLVGAYNSKTFWNNINGTQYGYGTNLGFVNKLSSFSSHGPMVDGRIKPDIAAPGVTLATSHSSYDTSYTATASNSPYVVATF